MNDKEWGPVISDDDIREEIANRMLMANGINIGVDELPTAIALIKSMERLGLVIGKNIDAIDYARHLESCLGHYREEEKDHD